MYRIKLIRRNAGSKRALKPLYAGVYGTVTEAKEAMERHIEELERKAWKSIGLHIMERTDTEGGAIVTIKPAITLVKEGSWEFIVEEV